MGIPAGSAFPTPYLYCETTITLQWVSTFHTINCMVQRASAGVLHEIRPLGGCGKVAVLAQALARRAMATTLRRVFE